MLFPKVLVTTYDIVDGEPIFLKSWNDDYKAVKVRDAARATSAAPTYFEPHQITVLYDKETYYATYKQRYEKEKFKQAVIENPDGKIGKVQKTHTLVDGGVFINSPAVFAYAEAKSLFPDDQEFLVLSLGTGQINPKATYEDARDWGMAYWARPLIKFMFDGVSDAADYQLKYLLGDKPGRYYRMQTDIDEASSAMDLADDDNIIRLIDSATSLIREQEKSLDQLCQILCGA
ncbi:MAG: patatin-like phospholipase family protein [Cyanobacteria bacterium J06554_11]